MTEPSISEDICRDFGRASRLEWLETNGTGGYAMGTVAGVNSRRYHGVLVAALNPDQRGLLLAKLDETVITAEAETALATNQYPGALSPNGWTRLISFRSTPTPTWCFDARGITIEKRLFLVFGEETTVVIWRASAACRLRLLPFVAFRAAQRLGGAPAFTVLEPGPTVTAPNWPTLHLSHAGRFTADSDWYRAFEYLQELERGLDFREDLWKVGTIELEVSPDAPAWLVVSSQPASWNRQRVLDTERRELDRRQPRTTEHLRARLEAAADQFLIRRPGAGHTITAGYPWFTARGRDAMIALPGLLLARGRLDQARSVLAEYLAHLDRGLIPDRLPDGAAPPEYSSADATLWLLQAGRAYLDAGGDPNFVYGELYPRGQEIVAWHERGTHGGIVVDSSDGLLVAASPGTPLTWMDARADGVSVTPRSGKAVEINALWYNALRLLAEWGLAVGDANARRFDSAAERVRESFARLFWNPSRGCLYDVVNDEGPDERIRPNQLLALALPYPLLSPEQRRAVLTTVENELLVEVGLRTLARGERGYIARYLGGERARAEACHQGAVWPWLLGPYVRAYLRVEGRTTATLAYCRDLLAPLERHLDEGCLGQVAEIFDAEPPYVARGAPAQALSVAELIAILHELHQPVLR